jgi:hypothetical protein
LHNDPRLIAALGAVAGRAAFHAGFSEEQQRDASAATVKACRDAFASRTANADAGAEAKVSLQLFEDRIELRVQSQEVTRPRTTLVRFSKASRFQPAS